MKLRTIHYYFSEAFRSVFKNRLMSLASIFTVASCLFIVSVFFILGSHVSFFVQQLGDTLGIVVFLEDDISVGHRAIVEGRIREMPQVTTVVYISPEEALASLKERMGDTHARILDGLEETNPLRSALAIEVADVTYQAPVEQALANLQEYGIANVQNNSELAGILSTISNVVQVITIALIVMLGTIAIVIITNTINITVNARRTEIGIMKWVGATDWFIRWPFILEGIIVGIIGSSIPAAIVWFAHDRVLNELMGIQELAFIVFLPRNEIFATLIPFVLGLGTLIGLLGSGVSVRRHLKV